MHICFIEDTHLHGGTQIWVSEAVRVFLERVQHFIGAARCARRRDRPVEHVDH